MIDIHDVSLPCWITQSWQIIIISETMVNNINDFRRIFIFDAHKNVNHSNKYDMIMSYEHIKNSINNDKW